MESPHYKRTKRNLILYVSTDTVQIAFDGFEAFVSFPAKTIDSNLETLAAILAAAIEEELPRHLEQMRKETK